MTNDRSVVPRNEADETKGDGLRHAAVGRE